MKALFEWLKYGHVHKWKILRSINLMWGKHAMGIGFYCQCEKCGRIKLFDGG